MSFDELIEALVNLSNTMDESIDAVHVASSNTQQRIYELLVRRLLQFDYIDGALDPTQPISHKVAKIQQEIEYIIAKLYTPRITEYLGTYQTVEDRNIALNKSYNELVISKSLLSPARKSIYDQAEYWLSDGLADAYVQPAKYLLLQSVTNGLSLKDAKSLLKNWNEGNLAKGGNLTSGRPTPRLQTYSTQVARDSLYSYNGAINETIAKEYGLTKFVYVGGLVQDSRPFCKHLVSLKRKIDITEVPPLVEKYPEGIIPGTTKKNFMVRRGGYNCQHQAMAVKG